MLLRPCLEYACTVWDPHTQTDSYKIEKIQRRAARWVLNRHRNTSSVGDMLDSLQWPTLADRRRRARLVMLYKVLDKSVAMSFGTDLQSTPQRPRRGASKLPNDRQLVRQFSANDYRTMAYLPRTIRDWNSLDQQSVAAPSLDAFFLQSIDKLVLVCVNGPTTLAWLVFSPSTSPTKSRDID